MSEKIIREGIQRLGIDPNDPDYIALVTLVRNIVTDVRHGRITMNDVDAFLNRAKDAINTIVTSKNLKVTVDQAISILLDVIKTAVYSSGSTLLDMYMKFTRGGVSGRKKQEVLEEEEKTGTII